MRLGTLWTDAGARTVVLRDGQLAGVPGSLRELLAGGTERLRRVEDSATTLDAYDPSRLGPAISDPGKVLCIGKNRMVHRIPDLIAFLSRFTTLEPGDVIATGTPGSVGSARKPPVWLRPGQTVICRIEALGDLKNQVVEEPPPSP